MIGQVRQMDVVKFKKLILSFQGAIGALPGGETLDLTVEPSRLLFGVDREAYKYVLGLCRDASLPPVTDDEEAA